MERRVQVCVPRDAGVFVAGFYEEGLSPYYQLLYIGICCIFGSVSVFTYGDIVETELRGKMEGGVAVVREIWGSEVLGVISYDSFEEGEVVEVDGAADTGWWINPGGL